MTARVNLLDYDLTQLRDYFADLGESGFRAIQVIKWIHDKGITDFEAMTTLSKSLRERLSQLAEIRLPTVVRVQRDPDGTRKWLLRLACGNCIETVYIPEATRATLCVSSQVGCALKCSFCATGKQGFTRNLSVGDIIGQLWLAEHTLRAEYPDAKRIVSNVVMMGMGEPLLNFDAVVSAMNLMMDDHAYGLSKRRVTLSTSGIIPAMQRLAEVSPVSLAVSLHAPTNELRNQLVPINKKYSIEKLMAVCRTYFKNEPRRKVTFEYVMLDHVNDHPEHARALVRLLADVPAKLNLIPFNQVPGIAYHCSAKQRIEIFADILLAAGINTIVRKTRGQAIAAACGQLNTLEKEIAA